MLHGGGQIGKRDTDKQNISATLLSPIVYLFFFSPTKGRDQEIKDT